MKSWLSSQSRAMRGTALAALVLISALMLSACGGDDASTTSSTTGPVQRGGTVKVATAVEPTSLDPLGGLNAGDTHVQTLIYNRLLEVEPGSSKLVPGLAESWSLSPDRKSATFHLRVAKFSDGTPVTSADVKFSFERAMDPKIDPFFAPSLAHQIASITIPDSRTVVLHFAGPRPAVFSYLAIPALSVINKHAFERLGAKRFAKEAPGGGSGPFKIVNWTKGGSVRLARNPHYWRKGLPYLDGVELVYVPDGNTRMLKMRSGQVDIADEVPYSQIDAMNRAPGIKVQSTPIAATYGILLNGKSLLNPQAVRQALAYATPTQAIRKIVFKDRVPLANSVIPPLRYNDATVKPYSLDIDKAKQLLAQSGLGDGFRLTMLIQANDLVTRQTAAIIQSTWSQIGVKVKIQSLDPAAFADRFGAGSFDTAIFPPTAVPSDIPSEDELAINYTTPSIERSILGFSDPKLHTLIKQIQGTWDEDTRRELFAEFQRQQLRNPALIPMTVAAAQTAVRDNVQGFDYVIMNLLYLDKTWLKR